jgi:hypothetical protein
MSYNQIYVTGLYNDFSHFSGIENINYRVDANGTQFLEIKHQDDLSINLTVPDGIFEWFIDIHDSLRNKLVSDWDECCGEPEEELKIMRQKAVEKFIQDVLTHKLRFKVVKKLFRETSTVEIFKSNNWVRLISNSKFKL